MQTLIRAARIIDAHSPFNGQVKDILIDDNKIIKIGDNLSAPSAMLFEHYNLHVSAGWVDMRVSVFDPGHEHREDLTSVCEAAAAGGFTEIAILPNTTPALDSKDTVGYVRRNGANQGVKIHAIAAVTKNCEGKDFTEMIDLTQAGAVGFSDGQHPIQNTHILLKTLQYLLPLDRVLMNRPEDIQLTVHGQMNEGIVSTMLGMRGLPAIAEHLAILKDLKLLEYVDTKTMRPLLHFSTISTAESVNLIREAKRKGLPVSCDVAAHQLAFDDSVMEGFDSNFKVNPPFRAQSDISALLEGLADGTIDAIVSDHLPHDEESKNVEFDLAAFGIIGLETVFSLAIMHGKNLTIDQIIDKITHQPRRILRLPAVVVQENSEVNLTLFDPAKTWEYNSTLSKSKNTPFLGKELTGKVLGTLLRLSN